jgi:sigma-B regulation protein RsbU (phosphoserine phosphatase)
VLRTLNQVLLGHETDRFCTVALVRLCRKDGEWKACVSLGGHAPPLLVRAGEDPRPIGVVGTLIGVLPETTFEDVELTLRPGDALVAFTDGVTEGRGAGRWFGDDGLESSLRRHAGTAASLTEGTLADVLAFQAGNARDDIVIVAVRVPEA